MEKVKTEMERETPVGQEQLIAEIRVQKPPRHFQCRVCSYTFEMSPCAHGLRGKDLTCPNAVENSKGLMTTVVKGIAVQRTVKFVASVKHENFGDCYRSRNTRSGHLHNWLCAKAIRCWHGCGVQ